MSNYFCLVGNITRNPVLEKTTNNTSFAWINLAVDRETDRDVTDYIQLIAWQKNAENICNFTTKGSLVCVTGKIQTKWETKSDGTRECKVEHNIHRVTFLDKKKAVAS